MSVEQVLAKHMMAESERAAVNAALERAAQSVLAFERLDGRARYAGIARKFCLRRRHSRTEIGGSMSINDGGPVFPLDVTDQGGDTTVHTGLSMRDYFAAKAMQAFIGKLVNGDETSSALIPRTVLCNGGRNAQSTEEHEQAIRNPRQVARGRREDG